MPREHKSRREVLDAIKSLPSIADLLSVHEGHFTYEIDLEVVVYGRNYNGKKVGPYVRLQTYDPGETVINEGEWGGNTFYAVVDGHVDIYVRGQRRAEPIKVAEQQAGTQFGEMSVLAGVPRNITVKAPPDQAVRILEVQRPALRLLRKLPKFGEALDRTYRSHGRNAALEYLKSQIGLSSQLADQLKSACLYRVYPKNHVLFHKDAPIDRIFLLMEGWAERSIEGDTTDAKEDFVGKGFCFGLEGASHDRVWPYSARLMGRTEVLEISIAKLRQSPPLTEAVNRELLRFAPSEISHQLSKLKPAVKNRMLSAQQALIDTGLVDATNLLVMDMDLCVRCGNCSLACHKVHGQSRLVRRGIHVTRLTAPRAGARQSVLAPQVCMHCKDPECLTGCPTGAIGRFENGQIDINASTCIGCGDCATNCPYDAISMIGRKGGKASDNSTARGRLLDLFRISADPLPPAVEQTEDLLAVKCNLCEGTSLNPPTATRPAYSCEENCPTGALARIDPRTYFGEIHKIEGLLQIDRHHAVARNIHRSDPARTMMHVAGLLLTVALTAGAVFLLNRRGLGEPLLGFLNMRWLTALVGLIAIGGVMTYPIRRQIYKKRAGPLRCWLLVHSYLGTLAALMIFLHGGTNSGGLLTTALMLSFDATILTGLFGIACYRLVPRMLTRIEGAPLLIDDLTARRQELQTELAEMLRSESEPLKKAVRTKVLPRLLSFGFLMRQYFRRETLENLLQSLIAKLKPVTQSLDTEADRRTFDRAIETAATLRRVEALIYLHRLLKIWLPPHVIFTALMLALMIVHIIQVIYYAAR